MRATPVIMRMIEGEVYAIFPSKVSSSKKSIVVFTPSKGEHEIPSSKTHMSVPVAFEHRMQMLTIMKNVGYDDLRYYKDKRGWMHRDHRLEQERLRNESRMPPSSASVPVYTDEPDSATLPVGDSE